MSYISQGAFTWNNGRKPWDWLSFHALGTMTIPAATQQSPA